MVDLKLYIQLIFLCVVNVIFTCAGIFLNLLVIVSFWRSPAHLRNKLYYFMIIVLSVFDFLVVITAHPLLIVDIVLSLTERNDRLVHMVLHFSTFFIGFSIMALLVMSLERYLGAYHPIFHRTLLTRRRLLTLLAVLFLVPIILTIIGVNDLVIPFAVASGVFMVIVGPPLVFFNYKLFMISRKVCRESARRRDSTSSPAASTLSVNLKTISPCLLSVGWFMLAYIPVGLVYVVMFTQNLKSHNTSIKMARFWTGTVACTNSTVNCLIFFWKNDVLRREGMKTVKDLKDCLKLPW